MYARYFTSVVWYVAAADTLGEIMMDQKPEVDVGRQIILSSVLHGTASHS